MLSKPGFLRIGKNIFKNAINVKAYPSKNTLDRATATKPEI